MRFPEVSDPLLNYIINMVKTTDLQMSHVTRSDLEIYGDKAIWVAGVQEDKDCAK